MEIINSIFKLLAGIGLFLFAMYLLEESLKNISGRNFKIFLQRATKNKVGAASSGALVTGILQSSSMVSLMVLAFVGAGVFTMKNALAIILGANLGSTLNGWLVATLGFKVNIEVIAYPAVCIGGLLLILFEKRKIIKYTSYFLFGFGLLFIGLSFMKTAMEAQVKVFDFTKYENMPLIVFLFIGFLITLLVQSSSVTMALILTALHVKAINFPSAAAIALGSETGTIIKIILSAIGGNASKKRVVLGNLLFNIFLTLFAFILLKPILALITDVFNIKDPIIGLVTFSSLINLSGIVIFLPLLDSFIKFLEKFFKDTDASAAAFIKNGNIAESETALDLFQKETEYFIHNSILFNLELFEINNRLFQTNSEFNNINEKRKFIAKTREEKYEFMKQLQGELQMFYLKLRTTLHEEREAQLNQLILSARSSMYSMKCLNDINSNIANLKRSSKDIKFGFFIHHKKETENLYLQLNSILSNRKAVNFEKLKTILNDIQNNYSSSLNNFYKEAEQALIDDLDITTAINFNRALFNSNRAMLMAIKDLLLNEKEAKEFNKVPVYIA
jgi:phosphate:Na+ symporter